jgi:hypothetical protein
VGARNERRSNRVQKAELQAKAWDLKLRSLSDRAAAAELGVSHTTIQNWTREAAEALAAPKVDEWRHVQLERLGQARQAVLEVLERQHVTISHGHVIRDGEPFVDLDEETGEPVAKIAPGRGEPILDDEPVLKAVDRLVRIEERMARLMGLDAPQKVDATVDATVTEVPPELADMIRQARERNAATRAELSG